MWAMVEARWGDVIGQIRERWPETATSQLQQINGHHGTFVAYLAQVHDLTMDEARDTVEEWLWTASLGQCGNPQDRRVLVAE
ncbi:MAG: hypothetical protein AAFQ79_06295 [Pseudomonadota bacterium]